MNYSEAVAYISSHSIHGMLPGLDRISGLLDMMGNPHHGYPIIHVAGTNGKTSVSRIASMLCVAHGLTAGTFTSPHLEVIQERLMLNGVVPTEEEFARAVEDVAAFAAIYEERESKVSYFELTAAMAFAWFADQAVDVAVVEVGLGGRWDATNAADGDVAVITSIGMDHSGYLGSTVEEIAVEKLQIVKPGSTLITGPLPAQVEPMVEDRVAAVDAGWHRYGSEFRVEEAVRAVGGWIVDVTGIHSEYPEIYLPMQGRHQTINLAVSIAAVESLTGRALDAAAVNDAIEATRNPGRMEIMSTEPTLLLDGAHNADGVAALVSALEEEFPKSRWVLVLATMEDKDLASMLPVLGRAAQRVVTTELQSPRAIPSGELAEAVRLHMDLPVEAISDPVEAVNRAVGLAGPEGRVLVTGSLYLVGAVRAGLGQREFQSGER